MSDLCSAPTARRTTLSRSAAASFCSAALILGRFADPISLTGQRAAEITQQLHQVE
jgi:hypothetical protein